jgi:amino acid transporter
LKSTELGEQRLNKTKALAILSSDALSSVAYGPEQILLVLITVSAAALWYSIPIAIGVLILLLALILSYRQIIFAYPHGGGAYMVAKQNLGIYPGLIAGGSLLVDYILTVAVSVTAGTDAITSAFPRLHSHNVIIAIVFVLLITTLNLSRRNRVGIYISLSGLFICPRSIHFNWRRHWTNGASHPALCRWRVYPI